MLLNRNDGKANERILYTARPNMVLGCKKAIYGVILLAVILFVSPMFIKLIGEMQVYLISQIKLPLTRYAALAFFVVILVDIVYIIWQLIGWYSMEYTLTESKIIVKSGVLSTKKNYMPYATIQDVNTSQSILARMFNVGSVSVFSAYDNNQMELKNVSNPSEVEDIIFSRITGPRSFQPQPQSFPYSEPDSGEYFDEYEPITPITHERNSRFRRDYEYYPEDMDYNANPKHKYEYEPYDNGYGGNFSQRDSYDDVSLSRRDYSHDNDEYYNGGRDNYSSGDGDYYNNNSGDFNYNEGVREAPQNEPDHVDGSSENAIRRHFDKFKK